jgi:signal transduction histidine kinase
MFELSARATQGAGTIDAAEQQRDRLARELHDETLQSLAAVRVRLGMALREESSQALERAGREAIEQIEDEIRRLRRLIAELRQ